MNDDSTINAKKSHKHDFDLTPAVRQEAKSMHIILWVISPLASQLVNEFEKRSNNTALIGTFLGAKRLLGILFKLNVRS